MLVRAYEGTLKKVEEELTMNPFFRLVFALVLATMPLVGISKPTEAGGAPVGGSPSVEWYNPPTVTYGGWSLTSGIYFKNPTPNFVKFEATVWYNGQAINPQYGIAWQPQQGYVYPGRTACDQTGCKLIVTGSIHPTSRVYFLSKLSSNTQLGQFTLGSVQAKFEDGETGTRLSEAYHEGTINLVEGPGFSIKLEPVDTTIVGGYRNFNVRVTDRYLNNFELVGFGVDCPEATVPEWITQYRPSLYSATTATFYGAVYLPDKPGTVCTVTALVRTRETTVAASYKIQQ